MADDFEIIPPDLLALASPAERKSYAATLRRRLALSSPLEFALATRPGTESYVHTKLLSDALANLPSGGRLAITMPPRHGKSFLVSETLPAWLLSADPSTRILAVSYGADLAATFGRRVRALMQSTDLAPALDPSNKAQDFFSVAPKTGTGFYRCTGVGGTLTGLGCDWLIIDDPIKDAADARSKTLKNNLWEWYTRVAATRLEPGGRIVVVGTRWAEDDLIGRLLGEAKDV